MIQAEITKVINFALQQNRIPVIQQISIINNSAMSLEDVSLHIKCDPDFAVPFVKPIQIIPANQRFIVRDINFILRADFLAALTERITGSLTIELRSNSDIITEISYEIIALAYDEWNGAQCYPELIAAFVMPNHPEVAKINVLASSLLKEWTGDPSLDGYQRKDLNRVKQQAAAVYGAFQKQHIIYSEPPASFETVGQRVRLCDTVIQQHMGTCLDLSLFYAACLEQMGLHPLLILQHGHIFAGVWLEDLTFPEAVQDDSSLITKRLSDDIGEITVVECTACTAGHNADFNAAESTAKHELQGVDSVLYIIDVRRARLSGIRPLPMRINTESGWQINYEEQNSEEQIAAPNRMRKTVPVFEEAETSNSKIIQWEHKLLDLGLRNTLINMRLTRTIVPILSSSLDDLEDALSSGDEFTLLSCPSEWSLLGRSTYNFENVNDLGTYKEIILQEFGNKHLRSIFSDADLKSILVNLYRTAKTNLEENGANTLYLALGILRWYESPLSCKPRYAPLVMLPVDIIRKSNYGYVIHLRDEDPQINITLLEFLKHNFNLVISGLDPLPNDEHGIDVRKTFAIIRHAIMEQPHWDVLESVFLGIFSFTQFVMWNDIRNRLSDLKRNKIVCSLLDGKLSWESESMQIGDSVPEDDTFLPLPADASQLFAICAAMDGESFVLDGPPGTGKSQTITTMIANAIAQGRTVLFVAEKRAALSVVRERLDKLGLTPFCLELHSNKSSKRYVLDQLKTATDITRNIPSSEYQKKAAQATILRENLNKYAVALHKIRLSGISVFDMLNRYEIYDKYISDIELSQEFVRSVRSESLIDFELVLERLLAAGKALGHPHGHPLRYIGVTHYSQLLKTELPKTLKTCKDALTTLISCYKALCQNIGYDYPSTIDEWTRVANIASSLYCWHELPRSWAKEQDIITLVQKVRELICHAKKAESIKTELMKRWMPSFLEQDGNELANRYKVISEKWFLSKAIGLHKIRRHLAIYSKNGINRETLLTDIQTLAQYRDEDHQCADFITMLRDGLEFFYKNKEYPDWEEIDHACFSALQYSEDLKELFGNDELRIQYAALKETNEITRKALNTWQAYLDNFKQLDELISVRSEFVQKDTLISSQVTMCNEIDENLDKLKEWMTFYGIALEAQNIGLKNVVSAYETGLAHDAVLPCFYRSIYKSMVQDIVENDDILNSFSGVVFNENISQFKRIDEELLATTRKEIYYRLAAKIPDFSKEAAHSSELGILQRAIGSGGRGISIRRLFEQIPHLLPRLCPCMLMSPISAAQYLDPKCTPFNIVIFDEASQLPTCKAVGVLARGENAIIVGDQNQMPPTSFFTSNDDFMDNQQDEDLESILRDCLALNMPRTHLQWHYRSRHESLIAFSNRQFYESRLLTFPSINDRESKVKFIPVHGYFDSGKTRQNRAEAKAIIEEIIRRFNDPELNKYSIGVVTFNIQQQTLVQDMLDEKCALNPELKNWIDHAGEYGEELWIKNLETVQGDERDVILFSIAFGPGENGARPSMNFGPLNRDGGWRRLNVAVSRARYEMIIFSSLQPEMIDLSRTSANAKGVKALKAFLEYAKNGLLSVDEYSTNQYVEQERSNGIAESICQALNAADYCTAKSIGKSEYRIDVGVIDPQRPDCYMLGILLDGKSYGHAKTVRDREIEQISVLEGLGWKLYRIWSMDWWDNKQKEIEKLLAYLEDSKKKSTGLIPSQPIVERKATEAVETLQTVVASDYKELEPIIVKPHTIARPYVLTKLLFRKITADDYINNTWENRQRFESVIAIEAPISESLLIHRVLQSYGIARAGRRIQAWSRVILNTVTCQVTKQGNQTFYWRTDQEPAMYIGYRVSIGDGDSRRAAIDVPEEEVANAACEVLEEQIGLPKEDLIKETAKKFGYQRNGPMVAEVMKNGIEYARISGRIRFDDSGYASRKHSF
jgi:hypothetical protein